MFTYPQLLKLLSMFDDFHLVGSAALYTDDKGRFRDWDNYNDLDYVVFAPAGFERAGALRELLLAGFNLLNNVGVYEGQRHRIESCVLVGYPSKPVDIILTETQESFDRWVLSEKVAKELGVTDRDKRVLLYNAIRLGR